MYGESKFDMQCTEFDALLTDALDGALTGEKLTSFERHKTGCQSCGLLFSEAEAGLGSLKSLEEVAPPKMLVTTSWPRRAVRRWRPAWRRRLDACRGSRDSASA